MVTLMIMSIQPFFLMDHFFLLLDQAVGRTVLAFIGRTLDTASFSNIYLYTNELYPTSIR